MSELYGLDEAEKVEEKITEFNKDERRPYHLWEVGGREYKLRLTTSETVKLEQKYKTNLMTLVLEGSMPPLSIMLTIIQAALTPYEHGFSIKKVEKLYDQYLVEGKSQMELFTDVVIPVFVVSGFFTKGQGEEIMESLEEEV